MLKLLPAIALIAFASVAVSCGGGEGGTVTVGVAGGVATSDDGKLTLDIPAGALGEEAEITITAVSVGELPEELREASGPGPAYRLEPDGLEFSEPVPVTLELDRSELDDVPEDGVVAYLLLTQDADGEIESLDELVTEATLGEETVTVRGELSHFSYIVKSDGFLTVELERVPFRQLIEVPFTAAVGFRNTAPNLPRLSMEPVFVNHFGVPPVDDVDSVDDVEDVVDIKKPGTVNPGASEFIAAKYVCTDPGVGKYGIDTTWRFPDADLLRSVDVTIHGEVECVTTLATPTPTPTETPVPVPTDTPEPAAATSTPTGGSGTTHTDPTGDEVVVGGGNDAVVDIRSVTIGPSGSQTEVFVTLGGDPSEAFFDDFSFAVRVTLGGQVGLLEVHDDVVNDAPPTGGSVNVTSDGVSIIFNKPVPTGVKLLVESFHLQTEASSFGSDTFTVMLP